MRSVVLFDLLAKARWRRCGLYGPHKEHLGKMRSIQQRCPIFLTGSQILRIVVHQPKFVPHRHCFVGQHSWCHPKCYNGLLSGDSCSGWNAQTEGDRLQSNFWKPASSYRQHQVQNKIHRRRNTVQAQTQPVWLGARLLFLEWGNLTWQICINHTAPEGRWYFA